jgi:serine/threonine protein kinase
MELLAGQTLRAELETHKILSPQRVLEIMNAVCDAVEEAHSRRLIHRDLKPENIFLAATTSGEVVKVLDFGLAKAFAVSTLSNAPTAASLIAGTPHYMAPEQLLGEMANPSWDLWALGVITCEMLTGHRPSLGESLRSTIPSGWQNFFRTALDPDPNRRLRTLRAFRSELQAAL